ncbi:MAG TPA: gliding motility-associated C-terminal domain-containing protein [Chitinophagaceae bacterium]|nr:gliding motility-associated C-terminal domain-containing protein [Chitinophagaceae bacterium]
MAQVCRAKILQKDTSICSGSTLQLTVAINDSADNCNTYSLSSSLQNGLLGWYPFCGNTNDISPNGNNGFATGPLSYTADRYNNPTTAIQFTGNGESVRTNKIDRTTINSFSYVVWVNTPNVVTLPAETVNPSSGFSTDLATSCVIHAVHGYNWNLDNQHTGAGLYISNNGVFVVEHAASIVATPLSWTGSLSGWHSIALVYDNHVPKLYVDGNFVKNGLITPYTVHPSMACDSFYNAGTYPYLTTGFGKGFNPSAVAVPFNNFKGVIDDIKIYNRALSPAEISELYANDKSSVLWSTGDTSRTIVVAPAASADYAVAVTNSLGVCRDTIHITVKNCAVAGCDTTGIISNDTTVCKGASFQLQSKNAFSYAWYPKKGLSDTTIQNPMVTIDTTRTYYLTSSFLSDNLVQNGDFEQGNTGFSSQYVNCNSNNCLYPEGYYAVGANPTYFQVGFLGRDHTTGTGNFMVVNGASTANVAVWCESINVKPNANYVFSTWLSNMVVGTPAQLQFSINGVPWGNIFTAPDNQYEWKAFNATWNSGTNTVATICIVNQNINPFGNDFGLDDIFFGQLNSCTDSIHIKTIAAVTKNTVVSLCAGQNYTLPSGIQVNQAGVYKDTLRSSGGCDSVITTVTLNLLTPLLKTINTSICAGQYYILPSGIQVNSAGVYKDTLRSSGGCDSLITLLNLTVNNKVTSTVNTSICEGENYAGHTTSGTYTDVFVAANGCDSIRTLNLIVKAKPVLAISKTICEGESFLGYTASGTYTDTFVAENGCDSIRILTLTIASKPHPDLGRDTTICQGDKIVLRPGAFAAYTWQDGSTGSSFDVSQPGAYSVTVSNSCGMATSAITIKDMPCTIYFPSAFTPNNDGRNDQFRALNAYGLEQFHLVVYNRWGGLVFETRDYSKGWDGNVNGQASPTAVFAWFCEFKRNGVTTKMKGVVTLIR